MFPYWVLFSIFSIGAVQNRSSLGVNRASPLLVLAALLVAVMIGLRFEVGGDWANYIRIFNFFTYLDLGSSLAREDPGYALLNWTAHSLGVSIWFVNLVSGAIFAWGLIRLASHQPNPWLACVVAVPYLIIVVAMGYTRQAIAIGFLMSGIIAFSQNKIGRFLLFILLAATFHKSAVVVIPLLLAAVTRNRLLLMPLLLLTAATLYYLFVEAAVDRLMVNYIEADYDSQGAAIRITMNVVPAILFLFLQNRFGLDEVQRKVWRNFSLAALASLVALFVVASSTAIDRLALYLIPLQIVVLSRLPYVLSRQSRDSNLLLGAVIVYSALIQFVWLNYAAHARLWLPYQIYPFGYDASALH